MDFPLFYLIYIYNPPVSVIYKLIIVQLQVVSTDVKSDKEAPGHAGETRSLSWTGERLKVSPPRRVGGSGWQEGSLGIFAWTAAPRDPLLDMCKKMDE